MSTEEEDRYCNDVRAGWKELLTDMEWLSTVDLGQKSNNDVNGRDEPNDEINIQILEGIDSLVDWLY